MARPARLEYVAVLDAGDIDEERDDELEVCVRRRANDGGRFDEFLSGRAGMALESMAAWAQHEIARCQRYATVFACAPEARGRALAQAADSMLAVWAGAGELIWALDCVTWTWRHHKDVRERPFSVEDHFVVVAESAERAPGVGYLVRTRGLAKFARPDVGMRAPRAQVERVSDWVREVGRRGAEGEPFQPGRRITVSDNGFALWPRSEDCLAAAPADEAPLFELREGGLSMVR